jgi:hypothetical protein
MPTRRATAAPMSARVHHGIAAIAVLAGLGGCAQVLGLEEWRPLDCETSVDVDPSLCEPQSTCTECLFATQATCEVDRQPCLTDTTLCAPIYACTQPCSDQADPLSCIKTCCSDAGGNTLFDTYLSCVCGACETECGVLTLGCDKYCDAP